MTKKNMKPPLALSAIAALVLAGCGAIQPARMALPEPLRGTEPISVDGMGAGQRGTFRAGDYNGEYARSATRLELFGEFAVFDRGRATYTVNGVTAEPKPGEEGQKPRRERRERRHSEED